MIPGSVGVMTLSIITDKLQGTDKILDVHLDTVQEETDIIIACTKWV